MAVRNRVILQPEFHQKGSGDGIMSSSQDYAHMEPVVDEFLKPFERELRNIDNDPRMDRLLSQNIKELTQSIRAKAVNVNHQYQNGNSLLTGAAYRGKIDFMQSLVTLGAHVNASNDDGVTAMFAATLQNHYNVVEWLVTNEADSSKATKSGATPLIASAFNGNYEMVSLLAKTTDVNQSDHHGRTALMAAAQQGHDKIVIVLMQQGANLDMKTVTGRTALYYGALQNHHNVIETIVKSTSDIQDINRVFYEILQIEWKSRSKDQRRMSTVKVFIALFKHRDISLDIPIDSNGKTHLMFAAKHNLREITEHLIKGGADVKRKSANGKTAFMEAALYGNLYAVQYLHANGAEIDDTDSSGRTALMCASSKNHPEIVKYLIMKGAQKDLRDNRGSTALNYGAVSGHKEVLEILLTCGSKVEGNSEQFQKTLENAMEKGDESVVNLLLQCGTSTEEEPCVTVSTRHGQTMGRKDMYDNGAQSVVHSQVQEMSVAEKKSKIMNKDHADVVSKNHFADTYAPTRTGITGNVPATNKLLEETRLLTTIRFKPVENENLILWLNDLDNNGNTPLSMAIQIRNIEQIKTLMKQGSDINQKDSNGIPPILHAVKCGDIDVLDCLLDHNSHNAERSRLNINAIDPNHQSAVHYCSMLHNKACCDILQLLHDLGCDGNLIDMYGNSPLITSIKTGNLFMARKLLELGVVTTTIPSKDALKECCAIDNEAMLDVLLLHRSKWPARALTSAIQFAALANKIHLLDVFEQHDVGVDFIWEHCDTEFLHSLSTKPNVLETLMNRGLDINKQDYEGNTLLIMAAKEGNVPLVKCLLGNGCKARVLNHKKEDACSLALMCGHHETVAILNDHIHLLKEADAVEKLLASKETTEIDETMKRHEQGAVDILFQKISYIVSSVSPMCINCAEKREDDIVIYTHDDKLEEAKNFIHKIMNNCYAKFRDKIIYKEDKTITRFLSQTDFHIDSSVPPVPQSEISPRPATFYVPQNVIKQTFFLHSSSKCGQDDYWMVITGHNLLQPNCRRPYLKDQSHCRDTLCLVDTTTIECTQHWAAMDRFMVENEEKFVDLAIFHLKQPTFEFWKDSKIQFSSATNVFTGDDSQLLHIKVYKAGSQKSGKIVAANVMRDIEGVQCPGLFAISCDDPNSFASTEDSGSVVIHAVTGQIVGTVCAMVTGQSYIDGINYTNLTYCVRMDHCLKYAKIKWKLSLGAM